MKILKAISVLLLTITVLTYNVKAQGYPLRTIEEIQFVLNPEVNDQSFFVGDTFEVRGLVMSDVRALTPDSGWACFIVDPNFPTDPWQGLLIVQADTFVTGTLFGTVQTGMVCRFTGVVQEIETFTQLVLLTDPLVPVVIESTGGFLPLPIMLGTNDLTNRDNGEQWEGQLVRIEEASITDNSFSSNRAIIEDLSGLPSFMDDYFLFYHDMFENNTYNWPPIGSSVDVTGFVRGLSDGFSVNPRNFTDLISIINAPIISNVLRNPIVPDPMSDVVITATITDDNNVANASLQYSLDWQPWVTIGMNANGDEWSAIIPQQSDETFVRYFISAVDNESNESLFPADTSLATGSIFRYVVRQNGLLIADAQNTYGYWNDESPYNDYNITLQGVVMSSALQFPGYYIQDAAAAWSGIFVFGTQKFYQIGDWIEVTGQVEEDFGLTKLHISSDTLIIQNFGAFEPVPSQTGDLATGGPLAEAFESVLVSFDNVTVTEDLPDFPNNFGEFIIDDGSGGMRVDDESEQYDGNLTLQIVEGSMGFIRGIHFYSFSDFKLAPRDDNDVGLIVGIDETEQFPSAFELKQNYPNPFNPTTTIRYNLPASSKVILKIYNMLGKEIRTLVNEKQSAGQRSIAWNGKDQNGNIVSSGLYIYKLQAGESVQSRKMLLIR